ncbi:hypothetical protein [Bdellovibrio sp. HCB-162]|uniref:hypothetical protein n=1 Tax=Bdellovibrio sp. HCB-162 TaxID=3394234 RepID=UPI0039BCDC6D
MQDTIREEIIRIIEMNRLGFSHNCEMDSIALYGGLSDLNIDAKIISGDLRIEDRRTGRVIIEFRQGQDRQPIGHCWVIIQVEDEKYFIDISTEAYAPSVIIFDSIHNLQLNDRILFVKGSFTFEYIYKSDGCNLMP